MSPISGLMANLTPRAIAHNAALPHDEARLKYRGLKSNTVGTFDDFRDGVTDYVIYHHSECVARGGRLSPSEAWGRGKTIIETEYRRRHGDIVTAFNDARDGTNGSMRAILDLICESMKADAVAAYTTNEFDRAISPASWSERVLAVRDFIAECGPYLRADIRTAEPERYARDIRQLLEAYLEGLKSVSSMYRRL